MRRSRFLLLLLVLATLLVIAPAQAATAPVPVVLVHGTGGSPQGTWASTVSRFEQAGYVSGSTLFAIDLSERPDQKPLSLLDDAAYVAGEVRKILKSTGAAQVNLVGHNRGGLIVRLLAEGETAVMVHRAVTLDTPHAGVLTAVQMKPLLDALQVDVSMRAMLIPSDTEGGSPALGTVQSRERRFADHHVPALAVGATWKDGVPAFLAGNDGVISLESQLAWPGAGTFTARLGPTAAELAASFDVTVLLTNNPHVLSHESDEIFAAVLKFLQTPDGQAPARACDPACQDFAALKGHWSEKEISRYLVDRLPYALDAKEQRLFEADRPMTRAEFVYGLARSLGLAESLRVTAFTDTPGHWSLGYVEAAVQAGLVKGLTPETFGPDEPLTRAAAATLIVRAKGLTTTGGSSRFSDARGHWAEAYIEAAAGAGIVRGDGSGFRPDAPMTMAEGAAILVRSFPKQ